MHDVSIKGLMCHRLCLSGRIVLQRATMGKKTQIVQDKSEDCVSGSWFISGGSVWFVCSTWYTGSSWKVEEHEERETNYQGHTVGGLLVEMI